MSRLFAIALPLLLPFGASAADTEGQFAVDGVGRATCADLTASAEARDEAAIAAFGSWTSGFLSGVNALADDTFDLTPWQSEGLILSQLTNFCRSNPETLYVDAVGQLVRVLSPARLTDASPLQSLTEEENTVSLYQTVLEGVRTALTDAGYEPADGDDGLKTALSDFQSAEGLDQTGLPDQPTLSALFIR